MGSGSNGNYGGGSSGSQPYAPTYHVAKRMRELDIKNQIIHDGRYEKNPTAKNLSDMINGNYIVSKKTNAYLPYVIDQQGNIIVANYHLHSLKRKGDNNGNN